MIPGPVIAVDVGGTKIRAGVVLDSEVTHVVSVPTPAEAGAAAVLDALAETVNHVRRSAPGGDGAPRLLGLGSAGVIDPVGGRVLSATDALPGWAGTELCAELSERTGLPCRAVNDVHAHCLGEVTAGAAAGARDAILVAAGTGIGAGIISNGRLVTGRSSAAGHLGHLPAPAAEGLHCPCGATGHLEAIASGPAVLEEYRRQGGRAASSSTAELADEARSGDSTARAAFETAARALGSALGGVANLLSPEVIVLGGGLSGAGDLWWPHVRESFERELIPALRGLPLVEAALSADAALIGAASLWNENSFIERGTP